MKPLREETMKTSLVILMGAAAVAFTATAVAAKTVQSTYGEITYLDQYSGDTLVFLENNPAGCEQGFWMRPSHAKFKSNLALVEKAVHSKARVKVAGNDEQRWPQTVDKRCRVQSITVEPVSKLPAPTTEPILEPVAAE
jgi:hypothetical protein